VGVQAGRRWQSGILEEFTATWLSVGHPWKPSIELKSQFFHIKFLSLSEPQTSKLTRSLCKRDSEMHSMQLHTESGDDHRSKHPGWKARPGAVKQSY
jgi:hypothetical protein